MHVSFRVLLQHDVPLVHERAPRVAADQRRRLVAPGGLRAVNHIGAHGIILGGAQEGGVTILQSHFGTILLRVDGFVEEINVQARRVLGVAPFIDEVAENLPLRRIGIGVRGHDKVSSIVPKERDEEAQERLADLIPAGDILLLLPVCEGLRSCFLRIRGLLRVEGSLPERHRLFQLPLDGLGVTRPVRVVKGRVVERKTSLLPRGRPPPIQVRVSLEGIQQLPHPPIGEGRQLDGPKIETPIIEKSPDDPFWHEKSRRFVNVQVGFGRRGALSRPGQPHGSHVGAILRRLDLFSAPPQTARGALPYRRDDRFLAPFAADRRNQRLLIC
eukprot:scaffold47_cov258-Pinguiococcus_pyrenoidosus.AAC.22